MDFKFSRKDELLRWAFTDFAEKELATKELVTLKNVPADIIRKIGDLGFLGLRVPEEFGGKLQLGF